MEPKITKRLLLHDFAQGKMLKSSIDLVNLRNISFYTHFQPGCEKQSVGRGGKGLAGDKVNHIVCMTDVTVSLIIPSRSGIVV